MISSMRDLQRTLKERGITVGMVDIRLAIEKRELFPEEMPWSHQPVRFKDEEVERWIRAIKSLKEAEKKASHLY